MRAGQGRITLRRNLEARAQTLCQAKDKGSLSATRSAWPLVWPGVRKGQGAVFLRYHEFGRVLVPVRVGCLPWGLLDPRFRCISVCACWIDQIRSCDYLLSQGGMVRSRTSSQAAPTCVKCHFPRLCLLGVFLVRAGLPSVRARAEATAGARAGVRGATQDQEPGVWMWAGMDMGSNCVGLPTRGTLCTRKIDFKNEVP